MGDVTLIWTALPQGIAGPASARTLRIGVHVSMRLQADTPETTLAAFRAIADWPLQVAAGNVDFDVRVEGRDPMRATRRAGAPAPSIDLWRALFPQSTLVRSYAPDDLTGRAMSSNKMVEIQQHVKGTYQRVAAASPVRLPRSSEVASALPLRSAMLRQARSQARAGLADRHADLARDLFAGDSGGSLVSRIADLHAIANERAAADPTRYTPVVPDDGTIESHFAALAAFHHLDPARPRGAAVAPRLDFHDGLAALGSYPALLPLLGLTFELEIPEAAIPQSPSQAQIPAKIQVIPRLHGSSLRPPVTPFTAYRLEGDRFFLPASRSVAGGARPDIEFGFLSVRNAGHFELIQVDVDGAGLKAMHALTGDSAAPDDGASSVPALRTSGVSLAWSGQDRLLHERFVVAGQNQRQLQADATGDALVFFAEDLVRGYRIDVGTGDERGPWLSLHRRIGRFEFTAPGIAPLNLSDEGMSEHAATQALPPPGVAASGTLRVQDPIAHWHGWSLSAPRVGKSIVDGTTTESVTNAPVAGGLPLSVTFKVAPGTLPRLRFGSQYRFRARAVDLAGHGWSVDEADALFATGGLTAFGALPVLPASGTPFVYQRFEPVPAPVPVARAPFTEGESLERMVIRSASDTSAFAYAAGLSSRFGRAYSGACERHVVPPKGSLWLAETHGRLDASFGRAPGETDAAFRLRCERTYHIASKETGTLLDETVIDSATGNAIAIPDTDGARSVVIVETNPQPAPPAPAPGEPPPGRYAIHREAQLRLPYLPDPLAHGAALFGLPRVPPKTIVEAGPTGLSPPQPAPLPDALIAPLESILHVPFGAPELWPERLPFRLQIIEPASSADRIDWDAARRVLRVPLQKAERKTVRMSTYLHAPADVELFGIWQWIQDHAPEGVPVPSPSLVQVATAGGLWMLTPYREIEMVHAVQRPLAAPNFNSFAQRLADQLPQVLAAHPELGAGLSAEVVASDQLRTFALLMGEIALHGASTARVDLLAEWREPIDAPESDWPLARAVVGHLDVALPDPASATPVAALSAAQLVLTPGSRYVAATDTVQFSFMRHEFGDTRHRSVSYTASATTRFRDFLPPDIANDPSAVSIAGRPQSVSIRSRARPAPPGIEYVIPTFGWTITRDASGNQVRTRSGNGVRVYLRRPWFSSGAGELLGVVLAPPGTETRIEHCATTWGRDPAWTSGPVTPSLQHAFPAAVAMTTGISLDTADAPSRTLVRVAGHRVDWDDARKLWFCDVEIHPGDSYFPFVRLALARFQPESISDAHLSRVVLADVVQVAPDRKVTVTPMAGDPDRFSIVVEGLAQGHGKWHAGEFSRSPNIEGSPQAINLAGNRVKVIVQERIPGTSDDAGWQSASVPARIVETSALKWDSDAAPGAPLWAGTVTMPHAREPGRFRVQIVESEHWMSDHVEFHTETVRVEAEPDGPPPHPPPHDVRVTITSYPGADRLVFADAIEL